MKKILALGTLALSVALCSEQQASAWLNCKFGIGLNWSWQSGGNNFLWGAFRNGQPPGPEGAYPGQHPGGPGPGYPPPGTFPTTPPFYGPHDFQYFGRQPNGNGQESAPAAQQTPASNQISGYASSPFQPVSYNPYYYNNMSYYPSQSPYGTYAAPSYWYGR